jgi:hypothetical protein
MYNTVISEKFISKTLRRNKKNRQITSSVRFVIARQEVSFGH